MMSDKFVPRMKEVSMMILTQKRQWCKVKENKKTETHKKRSKVCYFFGSIFRIQNILKHKGLF